MKFYKIFTALAATAALTVACSENDSLQDNLQGSNNPENAVTFSTYMGRTSLTRGGAYGSIDTEKLADPEYGFGVFAYYTGTVAYTSYRTGNDGSKQGRYPNFMYNEQIIGDGQGAWKYADVRNTKYWPNEIGTEQGDFVDDQMDDTGNDPAAIDVKDLVNGGNVTFFAYAPYAKPENDDDAEGITGKAVSGDDHEGTEGGIIAISGNKYNGDKTTKRLSDPYVQYRISNSNDKQVDLLWGTAGKNGVNVIGQEQPGYASEKIKEFNDATPPVQLINTADATVRPNYLMNLNLTKQKTNGTVDIAFKHALAKIGGSYIGTGEGDDEDGSTATNGLMVILDIDKDGQEFGGSLQPYAGGDNVDNTPYNTKVTINEVVLKSGKQISNAGADAVNNGQEIKEEYIEDLLNQGILNLATGVWHNLETAGSTERTQTIVPTDVKATDANDDADLDKDAVLSEELAEPVEANWTNAHTKEAFEALPIGVTTVAKNVYESEAQPFVFIPGTHPIIDITIDYTVRTYDAKLADKYTEVRQRITKRLYILKTIELNKQYNILMHLGLTSVKFTASVSEWEVTDATGTTTDPGDGSSPVATYEEEMEHVYLPINVASIASVTIGDQTYTPEKGENENYTITLDEQAKDANNALELGVITFTRADGTTLKTDGTINDQTKKTDTKFSASIDGIEGAAVEIDGDGKVTVTLPANGGVSRSATVTIVAQGPATNGGNATEGVTLAKIDIVIPQAGTATTTEAAVAYTYDDNYTYKGTFAAKDEKTVTYDTDVTKIGTTPAVGYNVMTDFARILGALYRAGGVTEITYGGKTYTWSTESSELKGSNWRDANGTTLVSVLTNQFKSSIGAGSSTLNLATDRGPIAIQINIKSSSELAVEALGNDKFAANANSVTYTRAADATIADIISTDLNAFFEKLQSDGAVSKLTYNGTEYTYDETNKWKALIDQMAYDYRNGLSAGTQITFGAATGDITVTFN